MRQRLVFIPSSDWYITWKVITVILGFFELIVYPFIAAFGVSEDYDNLVSFVLDVLTTLFMIDIGMNFFKAVQQNDLQFIEDPTFIM